MIVPSRPVIPFFAYLIAWWVADLLAYVYRFGGGLLSFFGNPILLIVPITQVVAVAALLSWRAGRSVRARDVVVIVIISTVVSSSLMFWSRTEMSRSLLGLQLIFGVIALLVTRAALSRFWANERGPDGPNR